MGDLVPLTVRQRTYVDEAAPSSPLTVQARTKMFCKAGTNVRQRPEFTTTMPASYDGMTVVRALLTITFNTAPTGSPTVQAQRIAKPSAGGLSKTTWNNQPSTMAGSVAVTGTVVAGTSGKSYLFDMGAEMQKVCDGDDWWGVRITTTATASNWIVGDQASAGGPDFEIELVDGTPPPDGITPQGVVGVANQIYSWDVPASGITRVRAQSSTTSDFAAVAWDSNWIASVIGSVDTAAAGRAALSAGQTLYQRFKHTGPGGDSDWSSIVPDTLTAYGSITGFTPTNGSTTNDPTPLHSWTFANQAAFQLVIRDSAGRVWYDSGRIPTADQSWTPVLPAYLQGALPDNATLTSTLTCWDNVTGRMASANDPGNVQASTTWTCAPSSSTTAPSSVTAAPAPGGLPAVDVTITFAGGLPDKILIDRGPLIAAIVNSTDIAISGTVAVYRDWTAPGLTALSYSAAGGTITSGTTKYSNRVAATGGTITLTVKGLWVCDPVSGWNFTLSEKTVLDQLAVGSSILRYTPPYATRSTVKALALRGYEGPVAGVLDTFAATRSIEAMLADLLQIRAHPTRTYRVVFGSENIPALVTDLQPILSSDAQSRRMARRVSFQLDQVGEFPAALLAG